MASIRRYKTGWRAEVARRGVRKSRVFQSRQEARDWAARQEHLILNAEAIASREPLAAALDRYAREVSPSKRGARWEIVRLGKLARDRIARIPLAELSAADLADWRDRRMREVSAGTVLREITLLSAVLTQCRREWGLIASNPMADVRKPSQPAARTRRVSQDELDRLAHSAGDDLSTATARAFHAFLFAIETGMRAGEILGLRPGDVEGRVAHLPRTKNGSARDVPLSTEALRLLAALPKADPLFDLTTGQLDALWRKVRDRAGVTDLHFHDSRHEAVTRLSRRLDVLTLAKVIGHRDIRMLMVYYDESADDIAGRLG